MRRNGLVEVPVDAGESLRSRRELVVAFGFGDSVLADLVEQRFVADLENRGGLLAVPVGLFQSLGDGLRFGFIFGGAGQRFQATLILLREPRHRRALRRCRRFWAAVR